MAIRNIVKDGDSILNKKCRPVEKFDSKLADLLDDMAETMHLANGVGLAAPQVGILRRIVVIDVGDGVIELINPQIIAFSGEQEGVEGCLSFPGEWGITKRPQYVKVKAFDRNGNEFTKDGKDLLAKAFCHEIDHLNGIVFKQVAERMLTPKEIEHMND
ncbi:peptide deformylase [Ruminococcus sp. YE282]|jgi:peptide deformylase|uniref:peptide deformylase n=1 Tax=Ruminococcus sp. YE282 TaxID=3158780 RepID=UPI00088C0DF4|nr:peptide deformylase [Ruminococcus bromii]MEE3498684.1 peptide deformylase [Ruminococcus bromii]SCY72088.1 peptide deformylase [Ruminococcus bromii]